jgi:predicted NBD/HSP70 family sugar kinase
MKHVNAVIQRDKQVITAVLRRFGPLSRARIHDLTHIRQSTTSKLVRELLDENVLWEGGRLNVPLGRKQSLLHLNETHRLVAAIEFDDERVTAAILDLHPRVLHTVTQPTALDGDAAGLIRQLQDCLRAAMHAARIEPAQLIGIGIADPGLVSSRLGVTLGSSTIDFWRDIPLRQIFEREFGIPTFPESKTRAKAIAEQMLGGLEHAADLVYLDYGAGIGAGIITGGRLLSGVNGGAGEVGHTHLLENGPVCKCGSYGCLEALAGLRALETRVRKAWAELDGQRAAVRNSASDHNSQLQMSGWDMLRAAAAGDKICGHAAAEIAGYLGFGIANLVNLFNPSVVVLDSRLELAGPEMLEQIVRTAKRKALVLSVRDVAFRYSKLGDVAGVLGSALICLEKYFEIPALKPPRFLFDADCQVARPLDILPERSVSEELYATGVL